MEHRAGRSVGGRLAMWLLLIFCVYFIYTLQMTLWALVVVGTDTASWIAALMALSVLTLVGLILGANAWFTHPGNPDT